MERAREEIQKCSPARTGPFLPFVGVVENLSQLGVADGSRGPIGNSFFGELLLVAKVQGLFVYWGPSEAFVD